MSVELERYLKDPLWPVLVEVVHSLTMYRFHKRYVSNVLLNENPDITPSDLSTRLRIPFGEAIVILHEIKSERKASTEPASEQ
jgi:hypothetical protein